jgi:hypothetical protein
MTHFTESIIEQAAIDWEETPRVFIVNLRHVWQRRRTTKLTNSQENP